MIKRDNLKERFRETCGGLLIPDSAYKIILHQEESGIIIFATELHKIIYLWLKKCDEMIIILKINEVSDIKIIDVKENLVKIEINGKLYSIDMIKNEVYRLPAPTHST